MLTLQELPRLGALELALGRLAHVDADGSPWVRLAADDTPRRAHTTVTIPATIGNASGASVLLAVGRDADAPPLIVGFISETMTAAPAPAPPTVPRRKRQVLVDGERLVFDATREIVLRCGRASIVLAANGEIQIRGARVVNHSSGCQVLRGATVRIN